MKEVYIYNFSKCDVASGGMAVALKDHHRGRSTKYQCFLKYGGSKYYILNFESTTYFNF